MDTVLEFERIEKRYFGVPVLSGVSLALGRGRVLGLVGENGAGKSTLMNILGGCLPADAGRMRLRGEIYQPRDPRQAAAKGIAFIHQELNLFPNLSIAENIHIAAFPLHRLRGGPSLSLIDRREMRRRTRALLSSVDLRLPPDTLVERLSPGERQLVEVAKALSIEAQVIIFDEPTTSLTARESARLFALVERLRRSGISMVYISHALGDVLRLCDDVVVLRDGEVVGSGAARELTIERLIALMVGRRIDQVYPPRSRPPADEPALVAKGLSQPGTISGIGFTLRRGEVLGVFGLMGSGRTELARILFGLDPRAEGEVVVAGARAARARPRESIRRGLAFLTEDRRQEGLLLAASAAENIALVSLPRFARRPFGLLDRGGLAQAVARAGAAVGVQAEAMERQAARTLSGGNQQKVVLAKWLVDRPAVLILDEPTRGIDVGAKCEIYRIINDLAAEGTGILFIASEVEELLGMCDRILVLRRGEVRGCLERPEFDRETILRLAFGEESRP